MALSQIFKMKTIYEPAKELPIVTESNVVIVGAGPGPAGIMAAIAVSSNSVPGYYGKRCFFDHLGFEIPYRSLVPADMAISQASGTAAAMCVTFGCRPADLDVSALQHRLENDDAVVPIPPEERG
jgi:hypothetical protein